MRVHASLAFLVAGALTFLTPTLCTAQHRGVTSGAAAAPAAQRVHPTPPPAQPSRPHPGPHPVPPPPASALRAPFPNISTLSGPLPGTFRQGRPDLFRAGSPVSGALPYVPGYAYGAPVGESAPASAQPATPRAVGGILRVDATPLSAEVFVDGFYAGSVDDIAKRHGLTLPEGPHRLEIRASGYTSIGVDVVVLPNDVLTYRATLDREQPPAPPPPPTAAAATMYVVPGCYVGNVPPRATRVAAGCDIAKVRIIPPQGAGRRDRSGNP